MSETVMDHWPTPTVKAKRNSRKALTQPHWSALALEQAVELASGILPRELRDASELRGQYAVSSQLTLFAAAFPVSPIVSPADAAPPPTTATSGPSSPELFASCDPDGSWRKTYPDCSPVRLDGSSVPFSETWPRAGMTRNGRAYQRAPLVRLTDATASGLWPTPDNGAFNLTESPESVLERQAQQKARGINGNGFGLRLATAAQLWPTPCAEDAKNVPYQKGDNGTRYPMLLGAVDPARMWPTPASRDYRSPSLKVGTPEYFRAPTAGIPLPEAIGGQLNPTWVEWLMGYPLGWTACAAWGTRSSRKSRNGSAAASSPPTA